MRPTHLLPAVALLVAACQPAMPAVAPVAQGTASALAQEGDWVSPSSGLVRGQVGLALLEHPQAGAPAGDTGGVGVDEVPFYLDEAGPFSIALAMGEARHTLDLLSATDQRVATLDAQTPTYRGVLAAGRYRLVLRHDGQGDPSRVEPVFVKYGAKSSASGAYRLLTTSGDLADLAVKARSCDGCDLSGVTLSGASLKGASLAGAKLTGALLDSADLTQANLRGAALDGVSARGAKFAEAVMDHANLAGANLLGAVMNGAGLQGADLRGATLGQLNIMEALVGMPALSNFTLSGADMRGARLRGATLKGAVLDTATIQGADFTAATLQGCSFQGVDGKDADFSGAALDTVNFGRAYLAGASFRYAKATRCTFESADLNQAQFQYARLSNGNVFSNASGAGIDFSYVDSEQSNFQGAAFDCQAFNQAQFRDSVGQAPGPGPGPCAN